jgi:hypothetical protein
MRWRSGGGEGAWAGVGEGSDGGTDGGLAVSLEFVEPAALIDGAVDGSSGGGGGGGEGGGGGGGGGGGAQLLALHTGARWRARTMELRGGDVVTVAELE